MCYLLGFIFPINFVDGIGPLVKLLNSNNGDVAESASLALANLTTSQVSYLCLSGVNPQELHTISIVSKRGAEMMCGLYIVRYTASLKRLCFM